MEELFRLTIDFGSQLLVIGVIGAISALCVGLANTVAYVIFIILRLNNSKIMYLSKILHEYVCGLIPPFTLIALLGMTCCISKLLLMLGILEV